MDDMQAEDDNAVDDGTPIPGFSDDEIAAELVPFFAEVDSDYAAVFSALLPVFKAKGPPPGEPPDPKA
jgi:pyruvate-formate lyase-activating enzyme